MIRLPKFINQSLLVILGLVLIAGYSPLVLAEDGPACPEANGTTAPTGAAAGTYHYNQEACLWENDYYTWNPVTKETTPKYQQTYTYNGSTGRYDTKVWMYNTAAGEYRQISYSVTQPPAGATVIGGPPATAIDNRNSDSNSSVTPESPGSSPVFDSTGTATVNNHLISNASTGDALVIGNQSAGNAISGNASAVATFINVLQSSAGGLLELQPFELNYAGNVQGDIVIDPTNIPSSARLAASTGNPDVTIHTKDDGTINNEIILDAGSGNANVIANQSAGNATSGSANALANVVNVINSLIAAGQSFVGTLNIDGSLDGDILLPPNVLDTLLASNATSAATASSTTNQSINNQVNLSAASGNANVSDNQAAGSATTGKASTDLTVLNMTGDQIAGKDILVVFVNVKGKWVGMLFNAPAGAQAAVIGGGITSNTQGAAAASSTTDQSITNTINVSARSGDASVSGNQLAGNAASGNANASVNLLNMLGSQLSLTNWFGVLFINVLGDWNGSFGVDTAAGNLPTADQVTTVANAINGVRVFRFVPTANNKVTLATVQTNNDSQNGSETPAAADNQVLAASIHSADNNANGSSGGGFNGFLPIIGGLLSIGLLGTQKVISRRKEI